MAADKGETAVGAPQEGDAELQPLELFLTQVAGTMTESAAGVPVATAVGAVVQVPAAASEIKNVPITVAATKVGPTPQLEFAFDA